MSKLFEKFGHIFELSVSYTSRDPRPGEIDGKHYYFRQRDEIIEGITRGDFLESAEVHGNMYGTAKSEIERIQAAGRICVLEIDVQGLQQVYSSSFGSRGRYVCIEPPNHEELERRLRGRGTETEERVLKRLTNAIGEIDELRKMHMDLRIVNSNIDSAFGELTAFVERQFPTHFPEAAKHVSREC